MTTPQANPAAELWNQYTNNKGTPTGKKGIAFGHLINEASPRSSATAGSVSGLRRWASCGVEFPASTRKRRRTHAPIGVFKEQAEDIADQPSSDGNLQGPPRAKTNLVELLEKIRESKAKPSSRFETLAPTSSSPLPAPERRNIPTDSPSRNRGRQDLNNEQTSATLLEHVAAADDEVTGEEEEKDRGSSGSSDEFGDVDFDDDMVGVLEASAPAATAPQILPPQLAALDDSVVARTITHAPSEPPIVKANESDDEFGLDEDIFAEDLEHVASLYDARVEYSQEQRTLDVETDNTRTAPSAPPVIDLVEGDDDDFGDDIDVDEFAAAEVAATQAPVTNVCRPRT